MESSARKKKDLFVCWGKKSSSPDDDYMYSQSESGNRGEVSRVGMAVLLHTTGMIM